jgi:glycosyltransferase involved in cell wall biosynthesis
MNSMTPDSDFQTRNSILEGHGVLFINENLPLPFDIRPWQEALALKEAGMEVSVLCPRGKGFEKPYECLKGIHIYRHPFPKEADGPFGYLWEYGTALFWEALYSWRIYRERRFEVIHVSNPPDLLFLIGLLHRWRGVRFIYDQHDICPEVFEAKFGKKGFMFRILLFQEWLSYKCAHRVIATNNSYRDIARTRGKKDPKTIFVVRTGPDLNRIPPVITPDPSLRRDKRYLVGYMGVIGKQEGLEYLIQVAKDLIGSYGRKDILFLIVGGGTHLPIVQDLVKKEKLEEYFHFTGRVPDALLFHFLGNCDVCVNPDLFNQASNLSTMIKIMEYMALGKPIVQTDVVEGRFTAQEASLYARPNDSRDFAEKVLFLLENKEEAQRMGEFGKRRIEHDLNWNVQKQILFQAYESLWIKGKL